MTTEAFVDAAVRAYLLKFAQDKIRAEQKIFDQQKESLLAKYKGEYIAMHKGEVIDHDPSIGAFLRDWEIRRFYLSASRMSLSERLSSVARIWNGSSYEV